jgi:hypothetical protein
MAQKYKKKRPDTNRDALNILNLKGDYFVTTIDLVIFVVPLVIE